MKKIKFKNHKIRKLILFIVFSAFLLCGCKNTGKKVDFQNISETSQMEKQDAELSEKQDSQSEKNVQNTQDQIFIYVCGEVKKPGVYQMFLNQRVSDAISKAGGFTKKADRVALNLAEKITDGQQILVPATGASGEGSQQPAGTASSRDNLVNINTAGKEELMTLPGIGESRAESILTYRNEHGAFLKIEDIMNISGIKEAAFGKIKDKIKV